MKLGSYRAKPKPSTRQRLNAHAQKKQSIKKAVAKVSNSQKLDWKSKEKKKPKIRKPKLKDIVIIEGTIRGEYPNTKRADGQGSHPFNLNINFTYKVPKKFYDENFDKLDSLIIEGLFDTDYSFVTHHSFGSTGSFTIGYEVTETKEKEDVFEFEAPTIDDATRKYDLTGLANKLDRWIEL